MPMRDELILIVDGSSSRRQKLRELLRQMQVGIREADSCEEALDCLRRENIALVMTETELPTHSGLYLLKEIKTEHPDVEVILVSHNASSFNLLQALRNGAFDFIIRPVDSMNALENPLKRAFNQIRLRREKNALLQEFEKRNRELEYAQNRAKSLNRSIERLSSFSDNKEILKELITSAMSEVNARRGFIALFDSSSQKLGIKAGKGLPERASRSFYNQLPPGLTMEMARRGKPAIIPNEIPEALSPLARDDERQGLICSPGLLGAPFRIRGRMAGFMVLSGCSEGCLFNKHDLRFLVNLLRHAALFLENASLAHQLKKNALKAGDG